MSTAEITKRITAGSRRRQAAFVGFYYLLTILTGAFLVFFRGSLAFTADLIASALYIAMTAFLHELSKPPSSREARDPANNQQPREERARAAELVR